MKEFRLCIVVSSTIVWLLLGVIVYADEIVLMATHKRQIINTQTNNNKAIRFLANTPSANSVKNVTLPSGSSKEEIVQAIESLKTEGYLFVEQPVETILHEWPTDGTDPNDTLWTNAGMWGVKAVKTNRVWKDTRGDGIVVAVIDTGVQLNHEDVQGSLWINTNEVAGNSVDDDGNGYIDDINGYNFCANAAGSVAGGSVNDTHGHGTTIAGLIAGQGNNAKGIIGIAPNTKIMVIKANDCGENRGAYIASAIRYAINNGADVINGSWSFTSSNISEYRSEPTYDALVCARTPIALNITNGGSGYGVLSGPNGEPNYYWPTVSFSGGNGSGVSAQVSEIDGGVITEVTITNCGTGYTSAPTVTIHPATNGTITASGSGAIITSTLKKSVIPVFSSGNDNQNFITNNVFPAADPNNVISVGAIQNTSPYTRASFSNFGSTLDLVAPGQSLTSTKYHATLTNQYSSANDNGTSFATPLVVGAIALFRSYNENVSHSLESIKTRLHNSSFDIGIAGKDDYTGSGVLNIEALVYPIHISGTVRYYTHSAHTPKHIPNATVTISSDNGGTCTTSTTTTNAQGEYSFINCTNNKNYSLSVSYTDTTTQGITHTDRGKILKHTNASSIFARIASDTNRDGLLTTTDQSKITRLVNGLDTNQWLFYHTTPTAINEAHQNKTLTNISSDQTVDFVGVKLGDSNGDW